MGNEQSGPAKTAKAAILTRKYGLQKKAELGKNHAANENTVLGELHKVQKQHKANQQRHTALQQRRKQRAELEELGDNFKGLLEEYVGRPWQEAVQKPLDELMDGIVEGLGCAARGKDLGDARKLSRTGSIRSTSSDSSQGSQHIRNQARELVRGIKQHDEAIRRHAYQSHEVVAADYDELMRIESQERRASPCAA